MFHIDGIEQGQLERLYPVCADVWRYWLLRANETGGVPKLADIDLMELWQHAGHISISDVERAPNLGETRFRWRYAGTKLYELTGLELTGRYMDEVFTGSDEVLDVHATIVSKGNSHFWRRSIQNMVTDSEPLSYERLSMPLKNEYGDIGHVLSIVTWPDYVSQLASRSWNNRQSALDATLTSLPDLN